MFKGHMSEKEQYINGALKCRIPLETFTMLQETHVNTKETLRYAKYLENLSSLKRMEDKITDAALGKGWVDIDTFNKVIRSNNILFGVVVLGLVAVIVFLLTGQRFDWFKLH